MCSKATITFLRFFIEHSLPLWVPFRLNLKRQEILALATILELDNHSILSVYILVIIVRRQDLQIRNLVN